MGYIALAGKMLIDGEHGFDEGWNFGPDSAAERTVENVVTAVQSVWGGETIWSKDGGPHPHEAHYLKLDSSKARRALDWRPVWGFDEAISRSVQWYLAEAAGKDMQIYTEEQLETYRADQRALQEFN
jgi:CDP-glucose 4,6-dehydratase